MTELTLYSGVVVSVAQYPYGGELLEDAPIGATVLPLVDAVDFNEDGGTLLLGTETLGYTSADLEDDTITLTTPTAVAHLAGDEVLVFPYTVERLAEVELDPDGESVEARVPHGLYDRIPEGTRDISEAVALSDDSGDWVITDVLGQEPVVDGSFIDSETVELRQLLVTGENWIANSAFEDRDGPRMDPHLVATGYTDSGPSTIVYSGGHSRLITLPAVAAGQDMLWVNGPVTDPTLHPKVRIGEVWKFVFWAQAAVDTPTLRARVSIRTREGTVVQSADSLPVVTSGAWTKFETQVAVTATDGYFVTGQVQATAAVLDSQVRLDGLELRNMATGSLIVNGAIDGQVITGATVQTDSLANRGVKLDSTGMHGFQNNGVESFRVNASDGRVSLHGITITGTEDVGAGAVSPGSEPPLRIGNVNGTHLRADGNEIQGMSGGSGAGLLALNASGGPIRIGVGRIMSAFDFGYMVQNTDSNSRITISHALGSVPTTVVATSANNHVVRVFSTNSNSFTLELRNTATGALVGQGFTCSVHWFCITT